MRVIFRMDLSDEAVASQHTCQQGHAECVIRAQQLKLRTAATCLAHRLTDAALSAAGADAGAIAPTPLNGPGTSKGSWHTAQMAEPCPALATPGCPAAPGDAAAASASLAADEALCTTRYGWFTACTGDFEVVHLESTTTYDICATSQGLQLWHPESVLGLVQSERLP